MPAALPAPNASPAAIYQHPLTTTYRYDLAFNEQTQTTDPAGETTLYTLDSAGNRTSQTLAAGTDAQAVTTYSYASDGFQTSATDPTGRVTNYGQDEYGYLASTTVVGSSSSSITDIVTTQTTDAMGNVTSAIDADGNTTYYSYDNLNQVTATTSAAGTSEATTTLDAYDLDGNLVQVTNPDGHVTINTYDDMDRLSSTRVRMDSDDSNSSDDLVTTYGYDAVGNQTSVTDPDGNTTITVYDALLRPIETISPTVTVDVNPDDTSATPSLTTTTYTTTDFYGANSGSGAFTFGGFNPTEVIDPRGNITDTTYNADYQKTSVVQSAGGGGGETNETDYVNNPDGKVVETTVVNSDGGGNRNTYTFYDDQMRPTVSVVDMTGDGLSENPATTTIDDAADFSAPTGDLVTRTYYAANGNTTAATDPNGNTTTYAYDGANRKTSTTLPAVSVFTVSGGTITTSPTTLTYYDGNGNVTETVDPDGNITTTAYDALNRPTETTVGYGSLNLTTQYAYDAQGNKTSVTDPNGNVTTTAYDFDNRPTQVTSPEIANAADSGTMEHPVTTTAYDKDGNVTSVTDPDGIVTTTSYDQMNRPRFVTENATATTGSSDQLITENRYDADGNKIAQVLYNNVDGTTIPQVTTYGYDGLNRQTSMTLPSTGDGTTLTTTTTYDQAGDVLTVTDPLGQETDDGYDLDGRLTGQTFLNTDGSTAETRATTYDNDGNVLSQSDLNGTTTYAYNADNEQTSTTRDTTSGTLGGADDYTVASDYDADGNRTEVVYPTTDRTLESVFDANNRMTQMIDSGVDGAGDGGTTTFAYDADGNQISETLPSGQITASTYNAMNDVTTLSTVTADSTNVFNVAYGYNLAGQRIDDVENLTGQDERDDTWTYDGLYRLTGESWTGPDAQSIAYTYDSAGNRLSEAATSAGTTTTTTSTYNTLNELLTSTTGSDTTVYGYDADGNRVSEVDPGGAGTTDYFYDTSNRMTKATQAGSTIFTAAYDAAGNRIAATQEGTTTLYRYDGGVGTNFQEVNTSGSVNVEYVTAGGLGGGIGAVLYSDRTMDSGDVEYYTYDAIGNTVALTDSSGTPTQTTLYSAFGSPIVQTGTSDNDLLHNTKQHDSSTGLDYYGARYYDESTGTFTTRDPSGYVNGLNVYQSDSDDPMDKVDPTGQFWGWAVSAARAVGSAAVATGNAAVSVGHAVQSAAVATVDTVEDASGANGGAVAGAYWGGFAQGAETGTKAVVNAAASTAEGVAWVATAGQVQLPSGPVWGVTDQDMENGYATSSVLANVGIGFVSAGIGGEADAAEGAEGLANLAEEEEGAGAALAEPPPSTDAAAGNVDVGEGCGTPETCFVAGTPVLLGDGQEEAINDIQVGDRVATDGGLATNGKKAANPNATAVRPKTWRLVTMDVDVASPQGGIDVMLVQALQPLSEIKSEGAAIGAVVAVPLDLQEMGIPNVGGTVESISACPPIQSGPGRVVLTTVTHLSNDIYTLTLNSTAGQSDVLQPTGYHRFYTLDRGWVTTEQLQIGEQLRGDNGDLTVTAVAAETGVQRVFNMTVEDDHDYYVGDVQALTHNDCPTTYQAYTKTNPDTGQVYTGRTSGTGTPEENVAARDVGHAMTDQGYGPAQLDKSSSNYDAIRGREQDMIWQNGGAQSEGGTSGNAYNGIGPDNQNTQSYLDASNQEFGYGNGGIGTGVDDDGGGE